MDLPTQQRRSSSSADGRTQHYYMTTSWNNSLTSESDFALTTEQTALIRFLFFGAVPSRGASVGSEDGTQSPRECEEPREFFQCHSQSDAFLYVHLDSRSNSRLSWVPRCCTTGRSLAAPAPPHLAGRTLHLWLCSVP